MSAPGVQLSSEPYLTYFQPTIRQYLQGIRDAVASNNLPAAQQAFTQLAKVIPSPAPGTRVQTNEFAARISQGVQVLGEALQTGDLSAAQQAIAGLRVNIQSMSDEQGHRQQSVGTGVASDNGSDVSPTDGSGLNLNVRA
jgi:hypothetical protein